MQMEIPWATERWPLLPHPFGMWDVAPRPSFFQKLHLWLALLLMSFLASQHSCINLGGGLEPIKVRKPQVVSEIPRINLLSGVLICVMSQVLLQQTWQDGDGGTSPPRVLP